MSTKYIMDGKNVRIGYVKDSGNVIYAHGPNGENVGYYSKSSDTTFDRNGKRYGFGDLTNALVFESARKI
jgi:hypothetical protein